MRPRLFPLFLALLGLLAAAGAEALVLVPRQARMPSRYYEIVREKKECPDGGCFIEYIVLSDGWAIKKQFDSPDYDGAEPEITTRKMPLETADALLAQAAAFFAEERPAGSGGAGDRDTLYFFDGAELKSFTLKNGKAPKDYSRLFGDTAAAFEKAGVAEDFYLHAYYQPPHKDIDDFHIFASGAVIFSVFTRDATRMKSTAISGLDEARYETLRRAAEKALPLPSAPYRQCTAETGLDYAHIEIKSDGGFFRSYTCADDDGLLSELFRSVRALKPESK